MLLETTTPGTSLAELSTGRLAVTPWFGAFVPASRAPASILMP